MLSKSIRYLVKRGRRPAVLATVLTLAAIGLFVPSDAQALARFPQRPPQLTVTSQESGSANIQWQRLIGTNDYEVGLWWNGQINTLPTESVSATISVQDVLTTQPFATTNPGSGAAFFIGIYSGQRPGSDSNESRTKDDVLKCEGYQEYCGYYYDLPLGLWYQRYCNSNSAVSLAEGGFTYKSCGTTAGNQYGLEWVAMPGGAPTGWKGLYASETDALLDIQAVNDLVIYPVGGTYVLGKVTNLYATAAITGIPAGQQYLSVRGVDSANYKGDWAYLVTVGTAATAPTPVAGAPVSLSGLIYTDEVPNIEHYLLDETTLILAWQNIPGARHYDVRLNGEVTRITAQASSGQQLAVSLANLQGQNVSYQVRAVIETGSLDVRVKDADDELIYIVPPNSIVYSRWSADRSVNVDRLGMIKGPAGTERLMTDPEPLSDTITDLIGDVLKLSTLMDEDADAGAVQVWTLPLGLLGSIFLGGLTGYGAGRGRLDKAAIIAGGLVFFVCWGYLCPVYLKIPWPVIFSVIILVMGAAIVVALNDYMK